MSALRPASSTGVRADVAAWFDRRTTTRHDWPLERVLAAKGETTVAVVLPALDEEPTVGGIVAAIVEALGRCDGAGLVDEVVVVDGGSIDDTAAVAAAAGARVLALHDVLPDIAPAPGKGEGMWRGLAGTTADIVVYIDADLRAFDPAVVTALVGPLLTDPEVAFVKAAYDRPALDGRHPASGGGRVTELMARPLIGALWPELGGVLQPLGGEYAARRSMLERVPFRCGYGVDLGLLIDALHTVGLDAIAQVDLFARTHRNAALDALGRMSAEILATAFARLDDEGRLDAHAVGALPLLWQQVRVDGAVVAAASDVQVLERPPLRELYAPRVDQVATT